MARTKRRGVTAAAWFYGSSGFGSTRGNLALVPPSPKPPDRECAAPPACPECGSEDLRIEPFDFGPEEATGYRDSGEVAICRRCGVKETL
jgi:hypothetical protein